MNFYIDTKFHEYHKQHRCFGIKIGKPIPTINLISIGIISDTGESYYAVSKDFNIKNAWNSWQPKTDDYSFKYGHKIPKFAKEYWLRNNVLRPIFIDMYNIKYGTSIQKLISNNEFNLRNFKQFIKKYGKTNKQIADEIYKFIYRNTYKSSSIPNLIIENGTNKPFHPQFYGYYADYDWVVFAQLYGKMMNLPKGYPMFCMDLRQMLQEKYNNKNKEYKEKYSYNDWIENLKKNHNYPKQKDNEEHNAWKDALWNLKLHNFIINHL